MTNVPDAETRPDAAQLVAAYRQILTWLGAGTALGACAELAMLRHWQGPGQLVPWALLVLLLGSAAAWLVRRSPAPARALRTVAVVTALGSAYGVYEHLKGNLAAGPSSARYAESWASMPAASHLWAAASGAVGASPLLAPGMVGLAGVLLWLAVLGWRDRGA
jgi:hypothetical protein